MEKWNFHDQFHTFHSQVRTHMWIHIRDKHARCIRPICSSLSLTLSPTTGPHHPLHLTHMPNQTHTQKQGYALAETGGGQGVIGSVPAFYAREGPTSMEAAAAAAGEKKQERKRKAKEEEAEVGGEFMARRRRFGVGLFVDRGEWREEEEEGEAVGFHVSIYVYVCMYVCVHCSSLL